MLNIKRRSSRSFTREVIRKRHEHDHVTRALRCWALKIKNSPSPRTKIKKQYVSDKLNMNIAKVKIAKNCGFQLLRYAMEIFNGTGLRFVRIMEVI